MANFIRRPNSAAPQANGQALHIGLDEYVLLLESGDASAQREATIHRVSLTGDDRLEVAELGTGSFRDSEGLAWMGGNNFAVVEEEVGSIFFFTFDPTVTTTPSSPISPSSSVTLSNPSGKPGLVTNLIADGLNRGIEGVTFDDNDTPGTTSDDTFYVVKEADRDSNGGGVTSPGEKMGIYSVSRATGVTDEFLVGQSNFPASVDELSGIYYDDNADALYYSSGLPGSQEYIGLVTNVSSTPDATSHNLFAGSVPLNNNLPASDVPANIEGIAFSDDGLQMFAVSDSEPIDFVAYRTGDMDSDADLDVADIDRLFKAISNEEPGTGLHDIDRDGTIVGDSDDADWLVERVLDTLFGDADLDGDVDGNDLMIWTTNKWANPSGWAIGDFNGDDYTDGSDFNLWNANKFTTAVASAAGFAEGDVNFDGTLDVADIDTMFAMKNLYDTDTTGYAGLIAIYDLDGDSALDWDDIAYIVFDVFETVFGDLDLDGDVDDDDADTLNENWQEYVDSWALGDLNGDGFVNFSDFTTLNNNYGYGT